MTPKQCIQFQFGQSDAEPKATAWSIIDSDYFTDYLDRDNRCMGRN